jgi:hypothetical protein
MLCRAVHRFNALNRRSVPIWPRTVKKETPPQRGYLIQRTARPSEWRKGLAGTHATRSQTLNGQSSLMFRLGAVRRRAWAVLSGLNPVEAAVR